MKNPFFEHRLNINRRYFLGKLSVGLGSLALGSLLVKDLFTTTDEAASLPLGIPHFAPKAKRVIYLFKMAHPLN